MSQEIHARFLETAAALSPRLHETIAAIGPVELKRRETGLVPESLCRAVVGQQLSAKVAATIWERVRQSAGDRRLIEHIGAVDAEALRGCGLSGAKVKSMQAIAAAAAAGLLGEDELREMDHPARSQRLTAIWGIGQWTVDMLGIFHFGDEDIWPEGDFAARKHLERLTSRRRKTSRTAARFAPHRSYLALYMWRSADLKSETEG